MEAFELLSVGKKMSGKHDPANGSDKAERCILQTG
jgi:hypothetical protein